MEKEHLNNNLCDEILNGQGPGADLLAGDALSLKEPGEFLNVHFIVMPDR